MSGKRTAWVQMPEQLRLEPELRDTIRDIAVSNCRSIHGQILWWILQGIKKESVEKSGEKLGPKVVEAKERQA